jgi:hypothetical protein
MPVDPAPDGVPDPDLMVCLLAASDAGHVELPPKLRAHAARPASRA